MQFFTFADTRAYPKRFSLSSYRLFRFVLQVINLLVSGTGEQELRQPEQQQLKSGILLFLGSVVLHRGFRQAAPRDVRIIIIAEFQAVARQLEPEYGKVIVTCLRCQSKDTVMFLKKSKRFSTVCRGHLFAGTVHSKV